VRPCGGGGGGRSNRLIDDGISLFRRIRVILFFPVKIWGISLAKKKKVDDFSLLHPNAIIRVLGNCQLLSVLVSQILPVFFKWKIYIY
jgi:hypothetical protein